MKKFYMFLATCVMGMGIYSSAYCADATLNMDVLSSYVSRGVTWNDGLVLQPSLDVMKGGFDVNVWGNNDIDDYNGAVEAGEMSEIDLTMTYSRTFDKVTVIGGVIEYLFPHSGAKNTEEILVGGTVAIVDGLTAGLQVNYDYDQINDFYANLNVTYAYSVTKNLGVSAAVAAGYAGKDMSVGGESGFDDLKVTLKATYALNDMIGIGANINYVDSLDKDVLPDAEDNGGLGLDTNVYGGISINCKF